MKHSGFSGSYAADDVLFLLKPVSIDATGVAAKEALIQSGQRHYSEMIAPELPPDPDYLALYHAALARNGPRLALDIAALAASLDARHAARRDIVLVSLARAGTPIGILIARALRRRGRATAHYSISIIRDRGLDPVALDHILARHDAADIVFVDGWTGKGTIAAELRASLARHAGAPSCFLAVVADPAGQADLAATHDDYLIASGLLNGIVSGLVSRSILSNETVSEDDFHACSLLDHLAPHDLSRSFLDRIDTMARAIDTGRLASDGAARHAAAMACEAMVAGILRDNPGAGRNLVKAGIAEATRAFLRRLPGRLYLRDVNDPDVRHLLDLAQARQIAVHPLTHESQYRAVAVLDVLETGLDISTRS